MLYLGFQNTYYFRTEWKNSLHMHILKENTKINLHTFLSIKYLHIYIHIFFFNSKLGKKNARTFYINNNNLITLLLLLNKLRQPYLSNVEIV